MNKFLFVLALVSVFVSSIADARSGGSMGGGSFSSSRSSSFSSSRSSSFSSSPSRSSFGSSSFSSSKPSSYSYSRPATSTFTYSRPSSYSVPARWTSYSAPRYSYSRPVIIHSYDTHYYSSPYSSFYFWHGPQYVDVQPVGVSHGDAASVIVTILVILIGLAVVGFIWMIVTKNNEMY